jgi:ethanolamine utilization microcompartment shell protein EutS
MGATASVTAGFIGKILGSVLVMGAIGAVQQYLGNQMKEIGKSVLTMVAMLYRSFKNRNK